MLDYIRQCLQAVPALLASVLLLWSLPVGAEVLPGEGYARASAPGVDSVAAYLTLNNKADSSARLIAVSSTRARQVMIHQNFLQGDMMRMRHVPVIELPANSEFRFAPGAYHLMISGLVEPLRAGERVPLRLEFQGGQVLEVRLPVVAVGDVMHNKGQH